MTECRVRYMDVDLPGGAVLRLALATGAGCSEGGDLLLATGWRDSDALEWRGLMGAALSLPASAVPELRAALSAMEATP